ncbi:MAG TPA: thiamine phosphate synthase [Spirochaetota bacterium]|nr:thiamine phosphate synthase [Spirochaetota bacterium]
MTGNIYTAIDACVNRAIEGLRVCEDIFRFVLHHPGSLEFKLLRHSIRDALSSIPVSILLESRDIGSDSQKFIDTAGEIDRAGLPGVFRANIRRAAEAVRSLEELVKINDPAAGALFQSVRFRIYEVEKNCWFILQRGNLAERVKKSSCIVVDAGLPGTGDITGAASEAADNGAGIILLRSAAGTDMADLEAAKRISSLCKERGILFFLYSRPDMALLSGAQGLCLERDDIPSSEARKITGGDMLIGITITGESSAGKAIECCADFIFFKNQDNSVKLQWCE